VTVPPHTRILVLDGATFTLQAQRGLSTAQVHDAYLRAGADIISTDTFGALTAAAGTAGARTAREAADAWTRSTPDQPRFVAGVMSAVAPPGQLREVLAAQMDGLIAGGVDLLLAETLAGSDEVRAVLDVTGAAGLAAPVPPLMISVAVTGAGLLPSGERVEAIWAALAAAPPFSVGINCGCGAAAGRQPLETLARLAACGVSWHPSAGSPDAFGDFDESPDETAACLRIAAENGLVDIVGGCCGTTPEHIAAIAAAVRGLPARMAGFRE